KIEAGSSLENLEVVTDTSYDTSIPRLSNVSPAITNVLEATYDSSNGSVEIVFDNTTETAIDIQSFTRPFLNIESTISSTETTTFSIDGLSGITTLNSVNMDITPDTGTIGVDITTWNTSGDYFKEWTETGSGTLSVSHTIGDLKANIYYTAKVDGTRYNTYLSNSSGEISFTYTGEYSDHDFEVS
ncbi:unnamed protein product, partial [marine sediment metagenome]